LLRSPTVIGGIAGAVALLLVLAVILVTRNDKPNPRSTGDESPLERGAPSNTTNGPTSPAPVSGSPTQGSITGNCNGQGINIVITCNLPAPPSRAKILVGSASFYGFWFDSLPDQLPTPPPYEMSGAHCTEWDKWIRETDGAYFTNPQTDLALETGVPDQIVIRKIEVDIYQRTPRAIGSGTWIQCNWGGGDNTFYEVEVNTATRAVTVREFGEFNADAGPDDPHEDREYPMPPASISLKGMGNSSVRIGIQSLAGYKYEGALVVTASINGKEVKYTVGSKDKPLKWITPGADEGGDSHPSYGWDQAQKRWVKDFYPYQR
jgi:hypothetical protein